MAKITAHKCDRCGALVEYVESVSGKDLCGACSKQLTEWFRMQSTPTKARHPQASYGVRVSQVNEVAARDGIVRPRAFAEHANISLEYAYAMLDKLAKNGDILKSGRGEFVLTASRS